MTRPIDELDAAHANLEEAKVRYAAALDAVMAQAAQTGTTQFRTDRITVSVCTRRSVEPSRFLAWVQANRPTEVEPMVRPAFRRAFLDGLTWDKGEATTADGEVVDFAESTEYMAVRAR